MTERITFTIQVIPADRRRVPFWIPRIVLAAKCRLFDHRTISTLPAVAHSMVPYLNEFYARNPSKMPKPWCVDCRRTP